MAQHPKTNAVITGGGSGLGRAIALGLAQAGSTLLLVDSNEGALAAVADEVTQQCAKAVTVVGDVADPSTWERIVSALGASGARADLLVSCAGVAAAGNVEDVALDTWRLVMNTNFFGAVLGCRALIPLFKKQGGGRILNVASRAGISCAPQMAPYNASKAALISLSETLYAELQSDRIAVTVACPSYFRSGLAKGIRAVKPEQRELATRFIESSKLSAEDVARTVLGALFRGDLYCFPSGEDRLIWRLKRAAPRRCLDFVRRKYLESLASVGR
jgi:NAD(P)-dependent dehydrogenase (short-subunit alcohol dehydrogenase family)